MTDRNQKSDVWQGTMALMVLKTREAMGPLHGYGIARRIEQISGDGLSLNYGSMIAAYVPARRAAKVSPMEALRRSRGLAANLRE